MQGGRPRIDPAACYLAVRYLPVAERRLNITLRPVAGAACGGLWERLFVHGCTYAAAHRDVHAAAKPRMDPPHRPFPAARESWFSVPSGHVDNLVHTSAIVDDVEFSIIVLREGRDAEGRIEQFLAYCALLTVSRYCPDPAGNKISVYIMAL